MVTDSKFEKIIQGWERCKKCDTGLLATPEGKKAYLDCEYTTGLNCRKDMLIEDTITLLKEQREYISELQHAPSYVPKIPEPETVRPVESIGVPMCIQINYECNRCGAPMFEEQPFCMKCGGRAIWHREYK